MFLSARYIKIGSLLRPRVHGHDPLSSPAGNRASPFSRSPPPPSPSFLFLLPSFSVSSCSADPPTYLPTLYEIENGAKQSCVFVVGRSGNKSLDELVEADPDPTRKESTAQKETGEREQKKKVRTSSRETERERKRENILSLLPFLREEDRTMWGGEGGKHGLGTEGFGVLISCYPVCYREDSSGRG